MYSKISVDVVSVRAFQNLVPMARQPYYHLYCFYLIEEENSSNNKNNNKIYGASMEYN